MFRTLTFLSLTLGAAPAWASEVGTCLTEAGVRVAPHSDSVDPACGADCGVEEEPAVLCSTEDGTCEVERERLDWGPIQRLLLEASRSGPAPICIEANPDCRPGNPNYSGAPGSVVALELSPLPLPTRGTGTLPGAEQPDFVDAGAYRALSPPRRPPRA